MNVRKSIAIGAACAAVLFAGVALGLRWHGLETKDAVDMLSNVINARVSRRTVEGVVAEIEERKPRLAELAAAAGARLRINVFKRERLVEVSSPGWDVPLAYAMTAFSGAPGPKLREGDGQIPEGIYRVEYLNPNSRFYLSFKVSYPNAFDMAMAAREGRTNLGGDIMIHGSCATVGCVPIGDDAIEDVFYLVAKVGLRNVEIVMAPYDMRKGRRPELEQSQLDWYAALCDDIYAALMRESPGI